MIRVIQPTGVAVEFPRATAVEWKIDAVLLLTTKKGSVGCETVAEVDRVPGMIFERAGAAVDMLLSDALSLVTRAAAQRAISPWAARSMKKIFESFNCKTMQWEQMEQEQTQQGAKHD